jgi:hypothetical protein
MRLRALWLLGLVALAGCGSTTSSSSVSPQTSDNQQRDVGYVRAINQIMAPFSKPPASETDYLGALRKLQAALGQLGTLTPPPSFAKSQADLMTGLRAQAKIAPQFEHAYITHNAVAASNLEQKTLAAEQKIRAATTEMVAAYNRCQTGGFKSC